MQFHFLMAMDSGLNSGTALRENHPSFHHQTWGLDTWVLGTQLLSHPCTRQTATAGYIMQLMKGSNLLLVTVHCSPVPWHICRFFMSVKCILNHWPLYLFPLPYSLQHSVDYLLAIGTSLCYFSLKWNNIWNCVIIFCFKITDLTEDVHITRVLTWCCGQWVILLFHD